MAYELVEAVLLAPKLRAGPRLVLAVLAQHADHAKKQCYPGVRRIMKMTGMAERTVLRNIEVLREHGYISTAKGRSRARTTLYTLLPATWPKPTTTTCQKEQDTPVESGGSDLPPCKQNQEEDQKEAIGKTKSKAKTCDKSQEEKVGCVSKSMGKSDKGVAIEQQDKLKYQKNKVEKSLAIGSVAVLAPPPPTPIGTSTLAKMWTDFAATQGVTAFLTAKEGKMLRDAAKKVEYGNMLVIIPVIITEWKAFTDFCYHQGVGFTIPKTPQVAFFLKFVDKAYEFIRRRERKAALRKEKENTETLLLQTNAQRDERRDVIVADVTKPLSMAEKKQIMGIDSRYIKEWEKVFGPVTAEFRHPAFEPNCFYDEFCADPTLELPDRTRPWAENMRNYFVKLRDAHISHSLWDDDEYQKLRQKRDDAVQRIKEIELAIKAL